MLILQTGVGQKSKPSLLFGDEEEKEEEGDLFAAAASAKPRDRWEKLGYQRAYTLSQT